MATYLKSIGVELRHGSPYSPESQGVVERTNGDVKKVFLRLLLQEKQKQRNLCDLSDEFLQGLSLSIIFLLILLVELMDRMVKARNIEHFHNTIQMTPFKARHG